MRAALLVVVLASSAAVAQVAAVCGPGKTCTVRNVRATVGQSASGPSFCTGTNGAAYSMAWGSGSTANQLALSTYLGTRCAGAASQTPAKYAVVSGVWDWTTVMRGDNGSAASPSWSFTSDPDTGLYSVAANVLGVSVGGARSFRTGVAGTLYGINDNSWLTLDGTVGASIQYVNNYVRIDSDNVKVYSAGGVRFIGAATGSLPACVANWNGALQYDTTTKTLKVCNGTSWATLGTTVASQGQTFTATASYSASASPEGVDFVGPYQTNASGGNLTGADISCSYQTAGTGGTAGLIVEVYADGVEACQCTLTTSCATAARTALNCPCTGAITAGQTVTLRLSTETDCTANPQLLTCNVRLE